MKAKFFIALSLALWIQVAQAGQFLQIDYRDAEFRGPTWIDLQRDLRFLYPNLRLQDYDVRSIVVEAKLYDGTSDLSVRVSNYLSERRALFGNPRGYYDPSPASFTHLNFFMPYQVGRNGYWEVVMSSGLFKIRRVLVEIEPIFAPPPGPNPPPYPAPNPPPYPGPNPPPPARRYAEFDCQSWDRQTVHCGVGFVIREAHLLRQYSNTPCVEGRSWKVTGTTVKVKNGCRARFGVWGNY